MMRIIPEDWPFQDKPITNGYIRYTLYVALYALGLWTVVSAPEQTAPVILTVLFFMLIRVIFQSLAPEWRQKVLTEAEVVARVESRSQFNTPVKGGLRPDRISVERYGNHSSYVKDGRRYWGFDTKAGRDLFAHDFEHKTVVLTEWSKRRWRG